MKKIYLDSQWTLENAEIGKINATVPGCVHTDLINNGTIENIYWRDNNKNFQWIENCDWTYSCLFNSPCDERATIVFEGIDTYSEIYLNGVKLGETDNMFIPYRFDVTDIISKENNLLQVKLTSPIRAVEKMPLYKGAFTRERLNTRRIQCTYGWDWVDRFVTCGIFRQVYLEYENGIDVDNVYVYTENIDGFGAQIYTEINFKNYDEGAVAHVEISGPDGNIAAKTDFYADMQTFVRRLDVAFPRLWYPNGYGEQPLYTLKVCVGDNTFEQSFGIRTLRIMQLPDEQDGEYYNKARKISNSDVGKKFSHNEISSGFQVIVNGERIFCRGGNWVPCEPFPSEERDEKIKELVNTAKEMGANFLRVWGGGLFEKSSFYDECDRCGILVVQDFLMACGDYPEKEEWFIEALKRESLFAVKYLRNHPCLAFWQGDNENAVKGSDTKADYTGRDSALRGIAPQIYKYDKFRQLLPSSPYGGDTYASLTAGTAHITNYLVDIFNYFDNGDCSDYKEYLARYISRFTSEDGTFGAISRSSMLKLMTEWDLLDDKSEEMLLYHTKNNPALKRHILTDVGSFAGKVLGAFKDGEDKFFKYKYVQYEWVRVVFENVRRNLGYSNGMVFWMYNDCWPAAVGWSLVDYYGLPKAAFYSFKRCAKRIIGSISKNGDGYVLSLSSDRDVSEGVSVSAYMLADGRIVKEYSFDTQLQSYGEISVPIPWDAEEDKLIICDVAYSDGADRCFYKDGALNMAPCDKDVCVAFKGNNEVTLKASKYVHAVELEGECIFEDNYFSLLEGEVRTVSYRNIGDGNFTVKAYGIF